MSKLDNRNKELLELCRKQEEIIKELILKLASTEGNNKTSAPSCEQLEGMKRLTKYEPSDKSMLPYKLKDEELSTELDSIHKLGRLEDIMEKYGINSVEELERVILNDATGEQSFKDYIKPYKDIEEELGIDLPTLFKALKDRFYVANDKYNTDKCFGALAYNFNCSELEEEKRWSILGFAYGYEAEEWKFPEDYGKTWALTEEELKG